MPDCIGFNLIEAVLCHICRKERPGAVLVFLTGWDDIRSLSDQIKAHPLLGDPNRVLLLMCHGSMATAEQVDISLLMCYFVSLIPFSLSHDSEEVLIVTYLTCVPLFNDSFAETNF